MVRNICHRVCFSRHAFSVHILCRCIHARLSGRKGGAEGNCISLAVRSSCRSGYRGYRLTLIEAGYVAENKDVWTRVFDGDGPFFGATTTYLDENGNIQYAGATSPSYADAVFKAIIESYERYRSSQVRVDFRCCANQVPGKWLDPRVYFPLTEEQAKKCGVKFFTNDLVINWTLGTNYDGSEIYTPSDLVYYGQKDDEIP